MLIRERETTQRWSSWKWNNSPGVLRLFSKTHTWNESETQCLTYTSPSDSWAIYIYPQSKRQKVKSDIWKNRTFQSGGSPVAETASKANHLWWKDTWADHLWLNIKNDGDPLKHAELLNGGHLFSPISFYPWLQRSIQATATGYIAHISEVDAIHWIERYIADIWPWRNSGTFSCVRYYIAVQRYILSIEKKYLSGWDGPRQVRDGLPRGRQEEWDLLCQQACQVQVRV